MRDERALIYEQAIMVVSAHAFETRSEIELLLNTGQAIDTAGYDFFGKSAKKRYPQLGQIKFTRIRRRLNKNCNASYKMRL